MPGSWNYGTEWRVLGIHSSLLPLNLNLLTFTLIFSPGRETQSFLHSWSAAQMVGSLLGPKEKSCLELEMFEPQDYRKTLVQQQGSATIQSSHYTARTTRKSGEFFGAWVVGFFVAVVCLFYLFLLGFLFVCGGVFWFFCFRFVFWDFFFDCQDNIILNISCSLMDIVG